mmetsp:Transcript_7946/g.15465  ORF Transcript_7946/g.15465 Transcript_7946/m.15465 type:complete len:92 (-) Transcript_7946:579-854(-)
MCHKLESISQQQHATLSASGRGQLNNKWGGRYKAALSLGGLSIATQFMSSQLFLPSPKPQNLGINKFSYYESYRKQCNSAQRRLRLSLSSL